MCYFPKCLKIAFFEFQKPFSQNDTISECKFSGVIFWELNTVQSCMLYNFKDNFVPIRDL